MTLSFRTRLFVVATPIVMTVLTCVMFVGWSRVLAFEVQRLDERLCLEARGLQPKRPRGDAPRRDFSLDAARIEADIANKLRVASRAQLMLSIGSLNKSANFQSAHWNRDVNFDALTWTKVALGDMRASAYLRQQGRPAPPVRPPPLHSGDGDPERPEDRADRPPQDDCAVAAFAARNEQ